MPYFYSNDINILFIHIPKTGGTSLEKYFEEKYEIKLNQESLYTTDPSDFYYNISYQHQLYKTIKENNLDFRVDYNNIQIISIVRNPYNRIMSDLFFKNLVRGNYTKPEVHNTIKSYLEDANNSTHDNHRIPQYLFLLDENDEIMKNIKIMRTENLNNDMINLGYDDFDKFEQVSNVTNKNYYSYLNLESVKLINDFYDKDFEYFNYKKISTENEVELNHMIVNEEIIQSKTTITKYLQNYFQSVRDYVVNHKNNPLDKNDLNKIIFPIHCEIADNYTNVCERIVGELSKNYKDIIENQK